MTDRTQRISTYLLGKYALGECSGATGTVVEHMLQGSPALRGTLAQLEADRDVFAGRFPSFGDLDRTVRSRRTGRQSVFDRLAGFLPRMRPVVAGLAAAAAVLVAVAYLPQGGDTLSSKGIPETRMVVKRSGLTYPVTTQYVACAPGDTLQLYIINTAPVYYRVLSKEPGSVRRQYLPAGDTDLRAGTVDGDAVGGSLIIPEPWSGETLYTVTGTEPFTRTEAWAAVDGVADDSTLVVTEYVLNR